MTNIDIFGRDRYKPIQIPQAEFEFMNGNLKTIGLDCVMTPSRPTNTRYVYSLIEINIKLLQLPEDVSYEDFTNCAEDYSKGRVGYIIMRFIPKGSKNCSNVSLVGCRIIEFSMSQIDKAIKDHLLADVKIDCTQAFLDL